MFAYFLHADLFCCSPALKNKICEARKSLPKCRDQKFNRCVVDDAKKEFLAQEEKFLRDWAGIIAENEVFLSWDFNCASVISIRINE